MMFALRVIRAKENAMEESVRTIVHGISGNGYDGTLTGSRTADGRFARGRVGVQPVGPMVRMVSWSSVAGPHQAVIEFEGGAGKEENMLVRDGLLVYNIDCRRSV